MDDSQDRSQSANVDEWNHDSLRAREREARLEALLLESDQRFASLVDAADQGIWMADAQARTTFVNRKLAEIMGYAPSEVIGKSPEQFVPVEEAINIRDQLANRLRGVRETYDSTLVRKDGAKVRVRLSASPLYDSDGCLTGSLALVTDVTDQVKAEESLRNSEARYRLLFEANPRPMWVYDLETLAILEANDAMVGTFGYSAAELASMTLLDLHDPADRDTALRSVRTIHGTLRRVGTIRLRCKEGQLRLGEVVTHDLDWKGRPARLVLVDDVTERVKAEEALSESNQKLQSVVDSSPIPMVTVGTDRLVWTWNPAAERLFGWKSDEVVGRPYPLVPADMAAELAIHREAIRDGRVLGGVETRRLTKDGSLVDVSVYTAPIRDAANNVTGAMIMLVDNSERLRLQQQLLHAQKMEGIGRLAGGVAHDFNNLLTAILGYTDLSQAMTPGDSPAQAYLSNVELAASRAAELTKQLLTFARRQIIEPAVVDLNAVVAEIDPFLRRLIGEDVELVTVSTPDVWSVRVDPGQIEQVVINLAVNARDAMPDGGRLTIESANVTLSEAYTCHHAGISPGEYVVLAVSDTGTGMSDEVKAHAFEPFFTTKGTGKGTGLGLATCFGIVNQSGGHIWFYSEIDHGTTFKVYLPRVLDPETQTRPDTPTAVPGGAETILLVEDEPLVREMAADTLRSLGYTVLVARGGKDALAVSNAHVGEIDLLLTDVVMPHVSGPQLAEALAADRREMHVLFMSGYTENSIIHHGVVDAGVEFLSKPFTPAVLARRVRAVLDAPHA